MSRGANHTCRSLGSPAGDAPTHPGDRGLPPSMTGAQEQGGKGQLRKADLACRPVPVTSRAGRDEGALGGPFRKDSNPNHEDATCTAWSPPRGPACSPRRAGGQVSRWECGGTQRFTLRHLSWASPVDTETRSLRRPAGGGRRRAQAHSPTSEGGGGVRAHTRACACVTRGL